MVVVLAFGDVILLTEGKQLRVHLAYVSMNGFEFLSRECPLCNAPRFLPFGNTTFIQDTENEVFGDFFWVGFFVSHSLVVFLGRRHR